MKNLQSSLGSGHSVVHGRARQRSRQRSLARLGVGLALAFLGACGSADKCPGDTHVYDPSFGACVPAPQKPQSTGAPDAGAASDAGDSGGSAPVGVPFGKDCSEDADCNGGTCVNAPLPLGCTQTNCLPGEANEGVCPGDWSCLSDPSTGQSGCAKF